MHYRYLYPTTWQRLSQEARKRAGYKCEHCGIAHGTIKVSDITGNPYIIYLQAAHVNHDRANETPELKAVCPACHWRHYRQRKSRSSERYLRERFLSWSLLEPMAEQSYSLDK